MQSEENRLSRLPGLATAASLLACYGTLAVIALLGALGVAVTLDERLWAGAIVAGAALAFAGLVLGAGRHRKPGPVLIGGLGAMVLGYAMYGQYSRLTEVTGFVLLSIAAVRDWKFRRASKTRARDPDTQRR